MTLTLRAPILRFLKELQRAYARAIRSGAPRVPHPDTTGPVGGSLAGDVLRPDLVQAGRAGGSFRPSKLGLEFRLWWHGSKRQRARGKDVPLDVDRLLRAFEDELVRQFEAEERRRR